MDTYFYLNFQRLCCIFFYISLWHLFVDAEVDTVRSGFTPILKHRGRSSEAREKESPLSRTVCLSFTLLSVVGHPRLREEQSADSPFMADGGGGRGCWNAGTFQSGQQFFITAFLKDTIYNQCATKLLKVGAL